MATTILGFNSEADYQRAYEAAPFVFAERHVLRENVLHGSVRLRAWCRKQHDPQGMRKAEGMVSSALCEIRLAPDRHLTTVARRRY